LKEPTHHFYNKSLHPPDHEKQTHHNTKKKLESTKVKRFSLSFIGGKGERGDKYRQKGCLSEQSNGRPLGTRITGEGGIFGDLTKINPMAERVTKGLGGKRND